MSTTADHIDPYEREPQPDPLTSLPVIQQEDFLQPGAAFDFDWDPCELWLAARGYRLYPRKFPDRSYYRKAWYAPPFTEPSPLPYATCVRESSQTEGPRDPPPYKIAWAQDSHHRDIALKLIRADSDEYRIYQTLLRHAARVDHGTNVGVLLPLAVLDTPFNYAFVAMPRWGNLGKLARIDKVKDVLQFIRCTLEGLNLLHSYRIAHRDIAHHNMLVDCYSPDICRWDMNPIIDNHRRTIGAEYCIFDFNASIQLSPDTSLRGCSRPADESVVTMSPYQPADIALGEPVYNPFAFDVATLGNVYRVFFSRAVAAVPLLAPLLDKMTNHDLSQRFTAEEALIFFNAITSSLSDDLWDAPVSLEEDLRWNVVPAPYWSWTPPGFAALWSCYQTRPWTPGAYVIDSICSWPVGWRTIRFIRAMVGK